MTFKNKIRFVTEDFIGLAMQVNAHLKHISERKLATAMELSKSEIHRLKLIGSLPPEVLTKALEHKVEKYVLIDVYFIEDENFKKFLMGEIMAGNILERKDLRHRYFKQVYSRGIRR